MNLSTSTLFIVITRSLPQAQPPCSNKNAAATTTCIAIFSTLCRKLSASASNAKRSRLSCRRGPAWSLAADSRNGPKDERLNLITATTSQHWLDATCRVLARTFTQKLPASHVLLNPPSGGFQHWRYLFKNVVSIPCIVDLGIALPSLWCNPCRANLSPNSHTASKESPQQRSAPSTERHPRQHSSARGMLSAVDTATTNTSECGASKREAIRITFT